MKQTHSNEFAAPPSTPSTPFFAKGDRVAHRESGREGTVTYACHSKAGWSVTIRWDGRTEHERYDGRDIRKIESLF